ncbi:uncharacterized protein AB9X84_015863 isoform 1-T5 [Acanthopagrus schlegelii]
MVRIQRPVIVSPLIGCYSEPQQLPGNSQSECGEMEGCQPLSGRVTAWFWTDATCTLCSGIQEGQAIMRSTSSPITSRPTTSSPVNLPTMPCSRRISKHSCQVALREGDW